VGGLRRPEGHDPTKGFSSLEHCGPLNQPS
jgi:hypothetical protein